MPKGQREAGLAIGSPVPDAAHGAAAAVHHLDVPSIVSQCGVLKPALGFLIRTGAGPGRSDLASARGNLIPTFIVVAVIFIVINYLLTRVARYLERRLQVSRRGPKAPPADPMLNPALAPAGAAVTAAPEETRAA